MKNIIQFILKKLSQTILKKYQPKIIGVSGNVGKTSAKEAICTVLASQFQIRKNIKNYNNEIGVPLTIIGEKSAGKSILGWFIIFLKGLKLIIIRYGGYPDILILELGVDRPKDMEYLTKFIYCQIAVMTAIGEIPVHIEFFKNAKDLIKEKSILVKSLPENGLAILNSDDPSILEMKELTKAKILSYGFGENADLKAENVSYYFNERGNFNNLGGINFKINYQGHIVPFQLKNILGRHQIYPVLAAIAVGLNFGLNLVEISESIKNYQPPAGRMRLINGIKNTIIVDDTYNSSPSATLAALDALINFKAKRRIAVLGDMFELGRHTEETHRKVGEKVAQICDLFFGVGNRMIFALEEAEKYGMYGTHLFHAKTSDEIKFKVQEKIQQGDIILVKGSQGMRMERVILEIMAEPEKAEELLVRQEEGWKK